MAFIIKDYKKKQINQRFIDDVGQRMSDIRSHYDAIVEKSRQQKREFEERLKESGLHGVKSFEVKSPEEFSGIEATMNMLGDHKEASHKVNDLLKNVKPLTAIDLEGNIKKV